MIVIKEYLEIYGHRVELIIGSRDEEKQYLLKHWGLKDEEENPNFAGSTFELFDKKTNQAAAVIVWMPEFEFTTNQYTTLMHECVHVAFKVAKNCGLPFSAENNENIAYIGNYFYGKFLKKLHKMYKRSVKYNAEKANT